jgi:hypothetical protein
MGVRRLLLRASVPAALLASLAGAADVTQPTRSPVELYAEAWRSGDVATMVSLYHENFTLHYGGHNALSGDHVGKVASLAALQEFSKRTNRKLIGIDEVRVGPRGGVIVARERFSAGGVSEEFERVLVYTVRDGKLDECWVYDADPLRVDRFVDARVSSK